MKKIVFAVSCIAFLLILSLMYMNFLNRSAKSLTLEAEKAYITADTAYESTGIHLENIKSEFETHHLIYCAFIDQKLLDEFENELMLCFELYLQNDSGELKKELINLKSAINALKKSEEFSIKKVLQTYFTVFEA